MLVVLVGTLAYFRVTDTKPVNLYAPNLVHRVQLPPPISPEAVKVELEGMRIAAAEADRKLPLVTTGKWQALYHHYNGIY
jgi:hypothetical protein